MCPFGLDPSFTGTNTCNKNENSPYDHKDNLPTMMTTYDNLMVSVGKIKDQNTPPFNLLSSSEISDLNNSNNFEEEYYSTPFQIADKHNHSPSTMSLLHVNMRSITKNLEKLESLLQSMKFLPTFIAITETKLKDELRYKPKIKGYNFINKNSLTNAGGVGWFIYSKISYEVKSDYNLNLNLCEDLWIEIGESRKIILGIVYRHPFYVFSDFQKSFERCIDLLSDRKKSYIICGDFNIDLSSDNQAINNYIDSLQSRGCSQIINRPTRCPSNINHKSSLLDHIYTNFNKNFVSCKIIISDISDHLPVLTYFSFSSLKHHKNTFYKRNMKNFNNSDFQEEMKIKMNILLNSGHNNVNLYMSCFLDTFHSIVNKHAPLKKQSQKELKYMTKPWITRTIQQLLRHKNTKFKRYLRHKSDSTKLEYIRIRNKVTHKIKSSKKAYYNKLFSSSYSNSKSLWKNIEKVIQFKNHKTSDIKFIEDLDNSYITEPRAISNHFNKFFAKIGPELAKSLHYSNQNISPTHLLKNNVKSLFLKPITIFEITNLISDLDVNKSVPSISVPIKFIKLSSEAISPVLTTIFNLSFSTGCFPDLLKCSEIRPIYKSSSKAHCTNYRPVALLSPFAKLLEKCIYTRINNFFISNNLFFSNQFGFQKQSSTENAVLQIHQQLLESLEERKISCSIFVDLRKAFDTVDHEILLYKLEKYGVRGLPFNLLKCYFTNRLQQTIVNGIKSESENIICGVPQGSTLGPLLFLIYINDMHLSCNLNLNLFADDSYFSCSSSSPKTLESRINKEMDKVLTWLNVNKLTINLDKTSYMIVTNKKINYNFNINFGNQLISKCTQAKYLGVIIDEKLTWKYHTQTVKRKLASGCWALYKLRPFVNEATLRKVYFSLIYSILQYCISCWGQTSKCYLEPLNALNRRALRIICNVPWNTHTTPLFHKLKILKLEDLYKLQISRIMHQINSNSYKGSYNLKLVKQVHQHSTRFSEEQNYHKQSTTLNITDQALSTVGPKLWSEVPSDLKKLNTKLFVSKYKQFIINGYSEGCT